MERKTECTLWFLIGSNALLAIFTTINPELRSTLGLQRANFTEEPWTIVTSLFIHSNAWHIFVNMLTLYFLGTYLSKLIGGSKFMTIYFLGGLSGGVFYILDSPFSTVIGASGAVFAVGGALMALQPNLKIKLFPTSVFLPFWVVITGLLFIISLFPNIAWQAHLGGLLLGFIAGKTIQWKFLVFA